MFAAAPKADFAPHETECSNPNRDDYWSCPGCYHDLGNVGAAWWSCPDDATGGDMADLLIAADGEVKLDYDVIGRIEWASPVAHLWAAGEWESAGSGCCDCCFEVVVDPDAYDDLENERDELVADLKRAREKIEELTREIHALRRPEVVPR